MRDRRLDADRFQRLRLDALRAQLAEIERRGLAAAQQHGDAFHLHDHARPHAEMRALRSGEMAVQVLQFVARLQVDRVGPKLPTKKDIR